MSKSERRKGKDGEREVEAIIRRRDVHVLREQDGRTQGADFLVDRYVAIEAKRRNRVEIVKWSRELEAKVESGILPVIAYRPDREPWRASLPLEDLLELAWLAR
jgi:hypothetical protein